MAMKINKTGMLREVKINFIVTLVGCVYNLKKCVETLFSNMTPDQVNQLPEKYRDQIWGAIVLPNYIAAITRTKHFVRLKRIRQVGVLSLVHPSVHITRYEHCIGTYICASRMLDCLKADSILPANYRMAIEVAALLHDVGHGPFSHTWELFCSPQFNHELNGMKLIDDIIQEANLQLDTELIKSLISGDAPTKFSQQFKFIFDIVHNKRCGLDVDKWDYIKRDSHYLAEFCKPDLAFDDVYLNAQISADRSCIEYRYEDYAKIYKLFVARWQLHKMCYRQPLVGACESLLLRMLERNLGIKIREQLTEYSALDDENILELIRHDNDYVRLTNAITYFKEINAEEVDEADVQSGKIIYIDEEIPGPGIKMPPDNDFRFYGDSSKKEHIVRDEKPTYIKAYYRLLPEAIETLSI